MSVERDRHVGEVNRGPWEHGPLLKDKEKENEKVKKGKKKGEREDKKK
jgi:hypothetical protein